MALESELSRLRWRCRRGMLELDLLLQGFLKRGYAGLDASQRECFIRLLELPDQVLFDYLLGYKPVRDRDIADVVERIRRAATP